MKLLLHICCAPCGGQVIAELKKTGHAVTAYFYNPNIFPAEEYRLRFDEVKKYCAAENIPLLEGEYRHDEWLEKMIGLEGEPERGRRCEVCFTLRLNELVQVASEQGFEAVATTLTISPHKSAALINEIGREVAELYGLSFIDEVWRENDGFKNSCRLAAERGFHRQNYCGCEFSLRGVKE
jgi:hypothetical protein